MKVCLRSVFVTEESCPVLCVQSAMGVEHRRTGGRLARFTLDVPGQLLSFDIAVNEDQASLSDMVPLAWSVASRVNRVVVATMELAGRKIACRRRCCACCSYLVSLSVPEAFRLKQDLDGMPRAERETFGRLSVESARRILESVPRRSIGQGLERTDTRITATRLSRWYARLGLPCVFLTHDTCALYSNRPLVCREHLVEGSSESCGLRSHEMPQVVARPVSVAEALTQLTADVEGRPIESIMLPFALAWAQDNGRRSERRWPALQMVERFFAILDEITSREPVADGVPA